MALNLMYITNDQQVAKIAEASGVDRIFVDLEINGKEDRQGHLDTVISRHQIEDVAKVKSSLTTSELLVRVNPMYNKSEEEINRVINDGADIVMLPFFKTKDEVSEFVDIVGNRAETMLLLETPEAVEDIDSILKVEGIDNIHIGLNDLHLGYNMDFMFELVADGTVEYLANKIKNKNIPYGFGGIAQLGQGMLPAENIITEHYRLGSTMAILSRSFCNAKKSESLLKVKNDFTQGVAEIRTFEKSLSEHNSHYFNMNRIDVVNKVNKICNNQAIVNG